LTIIYYLIEYLQSNTFSSFFSGQNLITLIRVPSTNDYLKQELSKSTPFNEGTVIMAEEQTAGKGQAGSKWVSEPGKNLTFSLLLKPTFLSPVHQFDLNIMVCVSIFETLFPLIGNQLAIKWPNDVFVGDRKLGGVLIENILQGAAWKESIIGVGINVNQVDFGDVKNACSIKQLLHREYILTDLLYDLCKSIEKNYLQLRIHGVMSLKSLYIKKLYGLKQLRKFRIDGVLVEGEISDVDADGHLVIDFNGHSAKFNFKEVEFVF